MKRRMLLLGLCAALPGLACAQEIKLVNCRTLESTGNFVASDEVIVNDMVCQKIKGAANAGASASVQPAAAKPLANSVVSDGEAATSVVDAAKAASKRVAAAQDAIKEKTAQPEPEEPFVPMGPMAPAPVVEPAKTPEVTPVPAKRRMTLPVKPVVPEYDASAKPPAEPSPPSAPGAGATERAAVPAKEPPIVSEQPAEPANVSASQQAAEPMKASVAERAADPTKSTESNVAATEHITDPVAADAVGSFTDAIADITSQDAPESPATPLAGLKDDGVGDAQASDEGRNECAKTRWWKPWLRCRVSLEK